MRSGEPFDYVYLVAAILTRCAVECGEKETDMLYNKYVAKLWGDTEREKETYGQDTNSK